MGRLTRVAGLVLCAGLTGREPAAAQTPERFTVQVLLQDEAGVPADVLEQAKREAARVFGLSNIDLEWLEPGPYQPRSLTLRIVAAPIGTESRHRFVLGFAPGTLKARGIIAFAFYDRIQIYGADLGLDGSEMLGHVIAHELGHLLLPYDAHSPSGLMRRGWDEAQANQARMGLLTFTPHQAALIRERLSASVSGQTPARRRE